MADNEKHFEQQTEFKLSEEFSNALSDLFTTDQSVPPEVDRAILDMAHKHITAGPRHRLSVLRWAGAASAVAAVRASAKGMAKERAKEKVRAKAGKRKKTPAAQAPARHLITQDRRS